MFGEFCSSVSQTIDQGIGTTFDAHLMAGYRFLMRYYDSVRTLFSEYYGSAVSPCLV